MALEDFLDNSHKLTDYDHLQELSFVSSEKELLEYIDKFIKGKIKKGNSTGFKELDDYYLLKEGEFDIWLGHDNVGKSILLWFLAVVANYLHGWKAIIKSSENKTGTIYRRMIEFRYMKPYNRLEVSERNEAHKWFIENFTLLNNKDIPTAVKLIDYIYEIQKRREHKMGIIDPYNSLPLDKGLLSGISTHEYHYEIASKIRLLCDSTGMNLHLNTHAVTEALRNRHADKDEVLGFNVGGMAKPPHKADAEGGGKWANRADNFITVHRYVQHPELKNKTLLFVRKIKETETGGQPTLFDPVSLTLKENSFFDALGTNPFTKKITKTDNYSDQLRF